MYKVANPPPILCLPSQRSTHCDSKELHIPKICSHTFSWQELAPEASSSKQAHLLKGFPIQYFGSSNQILTARRPQNPESPPNNCKSRLDRRSSTKLSICARPMRYTTPIVDIGSRHLWNAQHIVLDSDVIRRRYRPPRTNNAQYTNIAGDATGE